ncbi:alpha-1,4-N-acetylglucosaminyltransferase [Onychomys torridus]|uniref:alpha-1,4-N-acetylglucosaminyltransferase n=1 Tax=Onychomys torridus TaxID=38674 RepID=UPI00167FB0F8|nr:alpha-1,4-N-acetylglucosaminyltransferase [Onychomys torridus]
MLRELHLSLSLVLVFACGLLYHLTLRSQCFFACLPLFTSSPGQEGLLSSGRSIVFIETSERVEPPPLVSCAVESAAKIYPEQPVIFFMKRLSNATQLNSNTSYPAFSLLSAIDNVFFVPLDMKKLFEDTPLFSWYTKVNSSTEKHWLHVSSDASRLAIIWKYGGIYLDTDVISIRPIPEENFLAAQGSRHSSNGVFGFLPHHPFLWACMENFVEHYNSRIWGNQGPNLMTRMLRVWCRLKDFHELGDLKCLNISFLHPQRFYPIPYPEWRRYYQVWDTEPSFNNSYALHLWNYMNQEGRTVVRGSNTLVENLYRKHCPKTYRALIQGADGDVSREPGTVFSSLLSQNVELGIWKLWREKALRYNKGLPELKSNETQREGSRTHNQERENNSLQLLPQLPGICIRDLENDCHLIKRSTLQVSPYVGLGQIPLVWRACRDACKAAAAGWPSLPDSGCVQPWLFRGAGERLRLCCGWGWEALQTPGPELLAWRGAQDPCIRLVVSAWLAASSGCPRRWGESGPMGGVSEDVAPSPDLQSSAPAPSDPQGDGGLPGKLCLDSSLEPGEGARFQAELLRRCARRLNISGFGHPAKEPSCVVQGASRRLVPCASILAASDCSGLRYPAGEGLACLEMRNEMTDTQPPLPPQPPLPSSGGWSWEWCF